MFIDGGVVEDVPAGRRGAAAWIDDRGVADFVEGSAGLAGAVGGVREDLEPAGEGYVTLLVEQGQPDYGLVVVLAGGFC